MVRYTIPSVKEILSTRKRPPLDKHRILTTAIASCSGLYHYGYYNYPPLPTTTHHYPYRGTGTGSLASCVYLSNYSCTTLQLPSSDIGYGALYAYKSQLSDVSLTHMLTRRAVIIDCLGPGRNHPLCESDSH